MAPVRLRIAGPPWSVRNNYSDLHVGGGSSACSARYIRWFPWPRCIKTASEAGFKAWIGRRDIICDVGVTQTLVLMAARIRPTNVGRSGGKFVASRAGEAYGDGRISSGAVGRAGVRFS